jgi:signal transduction histidine kinase/CheY-like chemotaxis protein
LISCSQSIGDIHEVHSKPALIRSTLRSFGIVAAALAVVGVLAETSLYPRLRWWFEDTSQTLLNPSLPMDHVLAVDVDEESIRRLEPEFGAWPYPREAYARVARFLSEHGARAIVFDILFSEPRQGDDALAGALNRRSVLAAAALSPATDRSSDYLERLKHAALFDAFSKGILAPQSWPDLTLPIAKLTQTSGARIGVISIVADADGVVRRIPLLHEAYGEVLPSLALAGLLAAEPEAVPKASGRALSLGSHTWPLDGAGAAVLRYPSNAGAVPVVPFFQVVAADLKREGTAHVGDLVRNRIVFVGSSSAVLGDFAYTPAGRLPGLNLNALFTEMLLSSSVRHADMWWLDALLLALVCVVPVTMTFRGPAGRPSEFLWGFGAVPLIGGGGGLALLVLNQSSNWLFATLAGLAAQTFALGAWLFALYRERQRLFYEKFAAQEASRMKTEFLSHMTHELRTPITAIMGFNKINQFTDDLGREQRMHNSAIVAKNCEHLLELVNNNLNLARIEAGQLAIERRPENASELLEDVVSTLRIMAEEKGINLVLVKSTRLPEALSLDPLRVREILINLIGNAVKFTEHGEITLLVSWYEGNLFMTVRDTGVGIPPESLARAFEPFQRIGGSRAEGTGLGLTITRKLVELMGGTIRATSTPGVGTEFAVCIPASETLPTPRADLVPAPKQTAPLAGNILVAEDVEHLRKLIEIYLQELGLACHAVSNGFEAVEAALSGDFDALLLDMEMPVMDGFEAVRVLRERGYQRPIVALTAHYQGTEVERARSEGCNDVISKPVSLMQLREVLGNALSDRGAISEAPISVRIDPTLAELVPKYLERCRESLTEFQDAVRSDDLSVARRIGHALHGTAGSFGFDELAGIGREIEQAAKKGDRGALRDLLERLDAHVTRLRPVFD